jgi:nucleotide-binding universal stress UspA family protein
MVGLSAGIFSSMGMGKQLLAAISGAEPKDHVWRPGQARLQRRDPVGRRLRAEPIWRSIRRIGGPMRSYLVVIDETSEARAALRYAARRASGTGGGVILLAIIPPAEFVQWGGVQAAMEEEAKLRAEAMVLQASGAIVEEAGIEPTILVRQGEPEKAIADLLAERDDVAALVLGAAAEGGPGPLVTHFSGAVAGSLPCPLVIVPGTLGDEDLDRLS